MGLTVNRQMAKNLTVNLQNNAMFYRQPSNDQANIIRPISKTSFNQELNDW